MHDQLEVFVCVPPRKQTYPWLMEGHAERITNGLKESTPRLSDDTENKSSLDSRKWENFYNILNSVLPFIF